MSRAQNASNDPLFYLLHRYKCTSLTSSNIDRIYSEWQLAFPDLSTAYSGVQNGKNVTGADNIELGILEQLAGRTLQVRDTFQLCVGAYQKSGVLVGGEFVQKEKSDMEVGRDSAL
jgi:hypothetical protein